MDIKNALKNFASKGFKTYYFETMQEASDWLLSKIKNKSVGIGGSLTIDKMDLYDELCKDNTVWWHWKNTSPDTLSNAQNSQIYMTSANAISEDGYIVNIDGRCNRIASSVYGPNRECVYFICGRNKLCENLNAAMFRAKNVAAPLNARRLKRKTPCAAKAEKCYNCNSPERICRATTIMSYPPTGVEACLIFINESLGY